MTTKQKYPAVPMSKRGEKDQLGNAQHKMGAWVPDGVPLDREWRRRLKREK
jgi:hypothetical protein